MSEVVADVHRDPPRGQVMTQRVVAQSMFMQTVTHQHHSASSRGGQPAHHPQLTTRRTRSESKSIIQHSALHSTTRRTRSESKSIIQHSALHSTTTTTRRRTRSESKSIIQHSALHSTTTTRRRTRSESKSIIQHSALHSRTRRRTRSESKSIIQVHSRCRCYLV